MVAFSAMSTEGSSPRIRGEFDVNDLLRDTGGIIPANTGRIPGDLPTFPRVGDHPREYGENPVGYLRWRLQDGSSPRIRGECHVVVERVVIHGIIPANTGRIILSGR